MLQFILAALLVQFSKLAKSLCAHSILSLEGALWVIHSSFLLQGG